MKNIFISGWLLVLSYQSALACDNCNVYQNMNPNDFQSFVALQYRTRLHFGHFNETGNLSTKHGGNHSTPINTSVWEYYSRVETQLNFNWKIKFRSTISIPWITNSRKENDIFKYHTQGIGDITLNQFYQVFNTKEDSAKKDWSQRVEIGMGVKLPTGSITKEGTFGRANLDLQPGTGSLDFLGLINYNLRYKKVGWLNQGSFKINGSNTYQFAYGNVLNIGSNFYYFYQNSNFTIIPMVGIYGEFAGKDRNDSIIQESGSSQVFSNIGIQLFKDKFGFAANLRNATTFITKDPSIIPTQYFWALTLTYNL